ncbi:glucosamine-6-phosphate deaminase [Streptomyces sp. TBY4]|uniref:glucosamine-6-phosphate deaminase n=1 Tax=Streptomyces sp. TBY4 TaxID=2962030 RepID=UPI0020B8B656|nr:glucosamine-6-phosphate deaminase [Streptomyces sp. TBY4]MCP3754732.1 glucosamine-6-phosphate deaminase [Streptomyces sp. TBY4]
MKIVITQDYADLSRTAADIVLGDMLHDRRVNMALTAGASPMGTYEIVTERLRGNPAAFSDVHFYTFDEVPLPGQEHGLTLSALQQHLYGPGAVSETNIHPITVDNHASVARELRGNGGLDLMLIGLGADGHFCGNMPYATRFDQEIYTYELKDSYPWYEDALRLLPDPSRVPEQVVTMGAAMLARVRRLVLIVSGAAKAEALAGMLEREISTDFPAAILRTHPNVVVIADREAASRLG